MSAASLGNRNQRYFLALSSNMLVWSGSWYPQVWKYQWINVRHIMEIRISCVPLNYREIFHKPLQLVWKVLWTSLGNPIKKQMPFIDNLMWQIKISIIQEKNVFQSLSQQYNMWLCTKRYLHCSPWVKVPWQLGEALCKTSLLICKKCDPATSCLWKLGNLSVSTPQSQDYTCTVKYINTCTP